MKNWCYKIYLIKNDGDKQHLQNDRDKLVKWSEKWQMLGTWM